MPDRPVNGSHFSLDSAAVSEVIQMALSDHVSFEQIRILHGLAPDVVKALMRRELKRGSYVAWRKRVRQFAERCEAYKRWPTRIPGPQRWIPFTTTLGTA